jgi:hypothetical protein
MKKLITLSILTLSTPLLLTQNFEKQSSYNTDSSQNVKLTIRSAPAFTIEFNGHYDFGVYELSANNNGDFSSAQFTKGENFGVRHGFGGTAVIKISIHDKGYLRLCFCGSYNRFSSKFSKYMENQSETEYALYNVFSFGAGIENSFTPGYKFKPLIGIGVICSVISGDARVFDENTKNYRDLKINPAFRLGLTLYSGLEYLINNRIGLNCGIKIVHANLWLKNTKVSENPNEIYLNDERVVPRIPFSGFRQFMWGALYGGVNIYFGIIQKDYYFRKTGN